MRLTSLALCFSLAASLAYGGLIHQPKLIPDEGDHGVYSVQDQTLGDADPDLAKAYDNFTLTSDVELTGIKWSGIWAEPLPGALSDVDFIVEIWNDASGAPDLGAGPVLKKVYEGGNSIGQSGIDLMVAGNTDVSPPTPTTPGGGPGADYIGAIPGAVPGSLSGSVALPAGDYWISIIADQTFENPIVVDPEWQWALGSGPKDGFYSRDRTNDPDGTPEYGILQPEKDLAFSLLGVPEPSGMFLCMMGFTLAGMARWRRR